MVGSLLRVLFAFLVACLVAGLIQVLFVITPAELVGLEGARRLDRLGGAGLLALLAATQTAVFSAPFALIAAAYAEWQGVRSWTYYALVGIAVALAGFLALSWSEGPGRTIVTDYALRAFLTTGMCAGFAYWMVGGRHAGGPGEGARAETERV